MQPIYIDTSDEITTVIERMKEASDLTVALVVPKGAILLQSIINLKLAKKSAADAGKEMVLVTTDRIGKNLAAQVGIKVFARLDTNNMPEGEEEEAPTDDAHVIGGVKVHRYYENDDKERPAEEDGAQAPAAPIIPKQILKEEPSGESPIVVRQIKTAAPEAKAPSSPAPIVIPTPAPKPVPGGPAMIETAAGPKPVIEKIAPKHERQAAAAAALPAEKKPAKKRFNWRRTLMAVSYVLILALLGAGGVGAFFLPKTTVTLTLKPTAWTKDFVTTASVAAKTVSEDNQTIPAQMIVGESSDSFTFKSTGTKEVGTSAAGSGLILNGYSSAPILLPAGAKISANGRNFTTAAAVTVPGASVEAGKPVPGSIAVNVTADDPGAESNLTNVTGTITAPTTNLYAQITGTTGGSNKEVAVVTQTDLANAKAELTKKLQESAKAKVVDALKNRDVITDEATDTFALTDFAFTTAAGTEADQGQVSAKGTAQRLAVDRASLYGSITARIKAGETKDTTTLIDATHVTKAQVTPATQTAVISTTTAGRVSPIVPAGSIKSQLVGKKMADGLDLIQLVVKGAVTSVKQTPSWWPNKNFPYSPRFLDVVVSYE